MQCSVALADLYSTADNGAMANTYRSATRKLVERLELFCGVCGETMGQIPEELYPLPCGHLIHNRFVCSLYCPTSAEYRPVTLVFEHL